MDFSEIYCGNGRNPSFRLQYYEGSTIMYYHSHVILPKSIISLEEIKMKSNLSKVVSIDGLIREII